MNNPHRQQGGGESHDGGASSGRMVYPLPSWAGSAQSPSRIKKPSVSVGDRWAATQDRPHGPLPSSAKPLTVPAGKSIHATHLTSSSSHRRNLSSSGGVPASTTRSSLPLQPNNGGPTENRNAHPFQNVASHTTTTSTTTTNIPGPVSDMDSDHMMDEFNSSFSNIQSHPRMIRRRSGQAGAQSPANPIHITTPERSATSSPAATLRMRSSHSRDHRHSHVPVNDDDHSHSFYDLEGNDGNLSDSYHYSPTHTSSSILIDAPPSPLLDDMPIPSASPARTFNYKSSLLIPPASSGTYGAAPGGGSDEEEDWFDTITNIFSQPQHLRIRKRRRRRPRSKSRGRSNRNTNTYSNSHRSPNSTRLRRVSTIGKDLRQRDYVCCMSRTTYIFLQVLVLVLFAGGVLLHANRSVAKVQQELQDSHVEKTNILHQMEWIEKRAKTHMAMVQQQQLLQQQQGLLPPFPVEDEGSISNQIIAEDEDRVRELEDAVESLQLTLQETAKWQLEQTYFSSKTSSAMASSTSSESLHVELSLEGSDTDDTSQKSLMDGGPLKIQVSHDLVPYISWMWLSQLQRGQWEHSSMEYHSDANVLEIIPPLPNKEKMQGSAARKGNGDATASFLQFFETSIPSSDESIHVGLRRIILRKTPAATTAPNPNLEEGAGNMNNKITESELDDDIGIEGEEDRLVLAVHFNAGTCGPTGLYHKGNNHYNVNENQKDEDGDEDIIIEEVCFGTLVNGFDSLDKLRRIFYEKEKELDALRKERLNEKMIPDDVADPSEKERNERDFEEDASLKIRVASTKITVGKG